MKTEILTLCEYASEHNGSLTIIDTFDAVIAAKFPWRAYFYIAAKINTMDCDIDCKSICLKIVSSENPEKNIFEATSQFNKPKNLEKLNVVAGLKGLIFESEGDYRFRIFLDKTPIAEHPFKVILKEQ